MSARVSIEWDVDPATNDEVMLTSNYFDEVLDVRSNDDQVSSGIVSIAVPPKATP